MKYVTKSGNALRDSEDVDRLYQRTYERKFNGFLNWLETN